MRFKLTWAVVSGRFLIRLISSAPGLELAKDDLSMLHSILTFLLLAKDSFMQSGKNPLSPASEAKKSIAGRAQTCCASHLGKKTDAQE